MNGITKPTYPLPLHHYKHKDVGDIIKWYVNKYEDSPGVFRNEIPQLKMPEKPKFTVVGAFVFSKNFLWHLAP